jgi:hypothetical protein
MGPRRLPRPPRVERGINALKHKHPATTRPDKPAIRFTATVRISTIDPWPKRLS